MKPARRAEEPPASAARGRWLLVVVAAGVFIAADDQTSVVTVLPLMIPDLDITADEFYRSSWIINGYLLGYLVALPVMGRVADVYGAGRIYAASLLLFSVGSVLVAVAPGLEFLVVARSLQAVGGGAVVPVAMAIVIRELPARARAPGLGAIAAASEAGALVGPLWGGAIADWLHWRAVFWINLPMAVPLAFAAWRLATHERRSGGVDWWGAALLGAALAVLTVTLADDPLNPRALPATVALLAAAAAAAAAFAWRELNTPVPLVRPAMLAERTILAAEAATLLAGMALITVLIGVPLFVNLVLAEGPLAGGITLLRLTAAVPVGALAGGWLAARADLRTLAALGMLLAAAGVGALAAWDEGLGEPLRSAPQLVAGLGFGLVLAPLASAVLSRVGEGERATAAAWLTLARVAGMLVGAAVLTSSGLGRFYARAGTVEFGSPDFEDLVRAAQVDTFREIFLAAAAVLVVAAALCTMLGRPPERGAVVPAEGGRRWWFTA